MPGQQDANIKLLYPSDEGTFFMVDTVKNGTAFDVIANVEIGKTLMNVVDQEELFVAVVNVSQATVLKRQALRQDVTPQDDGKPRNAQLRITIDDWTASDGDVLEAVATYKVTAGTNTDYSIDRSNQFVVAD